MRAMILVAVLLVAGCASREQLQAEWHAEAAGACAPIPAGPQWNYCYMQAYQGAQADHRAYRSRMADAIRNSGEGFRQSMSRPQNSSYNMFMPQPVTIVQPQVNACGGFGTLC